jgi:lipopolysaccharide biosynthesis regulator YciM
MKRFLAWMAPVVLGACACGLLADDSPPPVNTQGANGLDANAYIWFVEHSAAVSKDAETSAVQAVIEAKDLLRSKEPQVSIDFFTKALYDAKSPAVKRAIRMTLYDLYKTQGQNDKALDQLQSLIVAQE